MWYSSKQNYALLNRQSKGHLKMYRRGERHLSYMCWLSFLRIIDITAVKEIEEFNKCSET